ncbi:MAG: AMP-binding protein, partial [Burkholderiales bacterium]
MVQWAAQVLGDVLTRNAELHPEQEALVIDGRRLSYGELAEQVTAMARGLRALGVRRGDHVAVCMGNNLEWVVFFYAAAEIGAVTVPVNTRFKSDEL